MRHALWLGGMLVVLGGLFGMHGLDNHGGAGMDSVAHAAMASSPMTVAAGPVSAAGRGLAGDIAHDTVLMAAVVTDASGDADLGMGATGMCMAVLGLSLLVLLLIRARRLSPLVWLGARPARAPRARGRDPDPPSLILLSIQRC